MQRRQQLYFECGARLTGLSACTGKLCIFGHLGLVFIWSCFVSCLLLLLYYVICAPVLTEGTRLTNFYLSKVLWFCPSFFENKISTKQNIASTEIAHQFSAPKVPVSIARGEIKPPTPVLQPIYFSWNEKPCLWQIIHAC